MGRRTAEHPTVAAAQAAAQPRNLSATTAHARRRIHPRVAPARAAPRRHWRANGSFAESIRATSAASAAAVARLVLGGQLSNWQSRGGAGGSSDEEGGGGRRAGVLGPLALGSLTLRLGGALAHHLLLRLLARLLIGLLLGFGLGLAPRLGPRGRRLRLDALGLLRCLPQSQPLTRRRLLRLQPLGLLGRRLLARALRLGRRELLGLTPQLGRLLLRLAPRLLDCLGLRLTLGS